MQSEQIYKEVYILNPKYRLRNDKKRVILFKKERDPIPCEDISDSVGFVHPLYAILFSLFNGEKTIEKITEEFSSLTGLAREVIEKLISPLLENREELVIYYDGHYFFFPKNVLVKKQNNIFSQQYNFNKFLIHQKELDFDSWRLYIPLDIMIVINLRCVTDCIYCYADVRKRIDCTIPFERLKELIKEAKELGIRNIDISGGELFLYEHWEEFLKELTKNGFNPYFSTKLPLDLNIIAKLKNSGIKRIQLSIDTIIKEEMIKILNVKDIYNNKILKTLEDFEREGLNIYINAQMNSLNESSMEKLVEYLINFDNIKRISIGAIGFSLYKEERNYYKYRPSLEKTKRVEEFIDKMKEKVGNRIFLNFTAYFTREDYLNYKEEKERRFAKRARCSANFYSFIILPDGKVTICEELYWHPRFVIGDLMKQPIEEIWNSENALKLYNISQDMIRKKSACKSCEKFENCYRLKGVCWKQKLYAYGEENWDYPDPRCPMAPEPRRSFWLE